MIDALHHYPVEWIDRWQLKNGEQVTVRPVLPQDHALEREFVARGMSAQARYQRFQIGLRELPDSMASYLTDIDYQRHFALVVETFGAAGQTQIADARFVRDPALAHAAEFGLAVADDWQGLGIGQRLLRTLAAAARARGLRQLYGDVLRDNLPMLALARTLGYRRESHPDDARLVRLRLAIDPAPDLILPAPQHRGAGYADDRPRRRMPAAGW